MKLTKKDYKTSRKAIKVFAKTFVDVKEERMTTKYPNIKNEEMDEKIKKIRKEAREELLNELREEFQPDVRKNLIFPSNLEEWIEKKLSEK